MRSSKLSLRQKVMQKNSRLIRRREVYGKHVPSAGTYSSRFIQFTIHTVDVACVDGTL